MMASPFDDIFGGSGPQWTWEQMQRAIDEGADRERLPRALVRAVVKQESNWDPYAVGDGGRAKGFFQLHPGAATDAGIDPAFRDDIGLNIYGGTRYLRLKLDQAGGDVDKALRLYNGGGDPNYVANVRRHMPQASTRPGVVSRAASLLSPASAEAATPGQASPAAVWDDIFGTPQLQAPSPSPSPSPSLSPSPPTATSTPEQDAAYRTVQQRGQPPPEAAERAAEPTPPPALPEVPATRPPPATAATRPVSWPGGRNPYLPPGVPSVEEETLQEGITKPSTMLPIVTAPFTFGTGAVARPLVEGAAQTATELGGRWWETGKLPTPREALETFAWNLLPSVGEEVVRAGGRGVLRSGRGGQMLQRHQAALEAQGMGARVMNAPEKEALRKTFDEIAATGAKLDIAPMKHTYNALTSGQQKTLIGEMRGIDSVLAEALARQGSPGMATLRAWNIGDLQHLRSQLIKRRAAVRTPETQDLLDQMRQSVDDAIEAGIVVGKVPPGFDPQQLKQAQEGWRRMRNGEDLQALVTKHTSYNPNTKMSDLNLAALHKELQEIPGATGKAQKVLRGMGDTEKAALREEIAALSKRYPFVKIPSLATLATTTGGYGTAGWMLATGNPGGAVAMAIPATLSLALHSPQAMKLFRESIINGRGELSHNTVAMIINAARREMGLELGGEGQGFFTTEGRESAQAPGGQARATD